MVEICIFFYFTEIPKIEISSDQLSGQYYVGEYVKLKARIRNPHAVLCLTWQKVERNGSQTIDTTKEKYSGTMCKTDEHTLVIKNCNDLDSGTYFLLAACTSNMGTVISNKITLNIFQGNKSLFSYNYYKGNSTEIGYSTFAICVYFNQIL